MSAPAIAIIDYDMGNLHSVSKALDVVGATPLVSDRPRDILAADAVVLPGVGAFDPAMTHLHERELVPVIQQVIQQGMPFLGICLGLQVLFEGSEEGTEPGLGIFAGKVKRFQSEPGLTIPHMGWNQLTLTQSACPLWQDLPPTPWVYFVHSYFVAPDNPELVAATVRHGQQTVTAAIARNNVFACQFHPEKSGKVGLQLLRNFVTLVTHQCSYSNKG
ncbi:MULTISPECIES: imidazole glycerol phosphate synthase subunit HisH [unclassified Thermosynechococcus]|uniref:imidazole glycerol phosphate synthase subunit HisH n=1 Tax=unclassified Thermosynechococcus TaxID=2622553 RepID=UPI001A0B6BF5|nr:MULTISPECIES: imidazole glycerol phosphate synthase subunit HisH [unclassified Thermosynechococcus]HIK35188.1 imidazole glycerol phosphate synthase subunit HisH [Thermosynechococcus sp. M98_K2018_005]HIK48418.1 imidazole glycerol phosphate synthase subunit HisH [Thermosynechococcus sp. M55_K2018_012]